MGRRNQSEGLDDDGNGKLTGDCNRQSSSTASGGSPPAMASGGARALRASGRLRASSRRMLAAGRDGLGQKGLVGIWMSASWAGPYPKNDQIRIRPAYPFIYHLFLSRYSADTYRRRIRGVSVSGAYQTRDTCPECRVRVTEVGAGVIKRFVSIYSFYISF